MADVSQPAIAPESPDAFSHRLLLLVFGLVCVSLVTYLPEMLELHIGGERDRQIGSHSFVLSRLPREVLLVGIVAYLGYGLLLGRARRQLTVEAVRVVSLVVLWCLACFAYAVIVKDLPMIVPLLGLKDLQYMPLLLAGYVLARRRLTALLPKFADLLRWYVAPIIALGVLQTLFSEHTRTLLGARSSGPFANVNTFGSTLVVCALWFLAARISCERIRGSRHYGLWIGLCVSSALTTGSRTATVLAAGVAAVAIAYDRSTRTKLVVLAVLLLLVSSLPVVFSSERLAGRDVGRSTVERLRLTREVVDRFETPADLAFGTGLGMSSKSVTVVFGRGRFQGQMRDPHSTYFYVAGSFGLPGLIALLSALGLLAAKAPRPEGALFAVVIGLLGLTMNLFNFFPVDVLALFLGGILAGGGGEPVRPSSPR